MSPPLYHFTTSAHLPWIIESGELRPGSNRIGGFPDPDFIWATSDSRGDRTSSAMGGPLYRTGRAWAVRLTLDPADFFRWSEASALFAQWTKEHISLLEWAAQGKSDPRNWWCRATPLPVSAIRSIEAKPYQGSTWRPVEAEVSTVWNADGRWLRLTMAGRSFYSRRTLGPQGQDAYELGREL
ncbi:hypothetical protein [Xanthobacter autotrophicus]|uniref:hypothetical protein n=1 Tax=Xanthobacter autotrophicus TaxID=280 RepID=UPI00372B49F2